MEGGWSSVEVCHDGSDKEMGGTLKGRIGKEEDRMK